MGCALGWSARTDVPIRKIKLAAIDISANEKDDEVSYCYSSDFVNEEAD